MITTPLPSVLPPVWFCIHRAGHVRHELPGFITPRHLHIHDPKHAAIPRSRNQYCRLQAIFRSSAGSCFSDNCSWSSAEWASKHATPRSATKSLVLVRSHLPEEPTHKNLTRPGGAGEKSLGTEMVKCLESVIPDSRPGMLILWAYISDIIDILNSQGPGTCFLWQNYQE